MKNIMSGVDQYLLNGCMRCELGGTPLCKVNRWSEELLLLRQILLESELTEDIKWGVPCYTLNKKNVIIINAFKEYVCVSFFKGALLTDKQELLHKHGEHSQSVRILKFNNHKEIIKNTKIIKAYVSEAIALERSGKKVILKKSPEPFPDELTQILEKDKLLKKAFLSLTPGRIRGYIIYFTLAKQSQTRVSRIENCREKIMSGKGLNDDYKRK